MVAICCFQCDPRQATYVIAVISFLHFGVETGIILSLDEEHRLVAEEDGIKYITVLVAHFALIIASAVLFYATYNLIYGLIFPWLIASTFMLLLYFAILILMILRIIQQGHFIELERAFILGFQMGALIYAMWLVVVFIWEIKGHTYVDGSDDWEGVKVKSLFNLGMDDDDSDVDSDLLAQMKSKNRNKKKIKKQIEEDDKMWLLHHNHGP